MTERITDCRIMNVNETKFNTRKEKIQNIRFERSYTSTKTKYMASSKSQNPKSPKDSLENSTNSHGIELHVTFKIPRANLINR